MILDLGTESFGNGSLFTQLKENYVLIKHFGPVYIDFYCYPPYSGTISKFSDILPLYGGYSSK